MSPTFAVTGAATKSPVGPTRSSFTTEIDAGGAGAVFCAGGVGADGGVFGVVQVLVPPFSE